MRGINNYNPLDDPWRNENDLWEYIKNGKLKDITIGALLNMFYGRLSDEQRADLAANLKEQYTDNPDMLELIDKLAEGDFAIETGVKGGQCVNYAADYFGKIFGVGPAKDIQYADTTVTRLDGPESGCVVVWVHNTNESAAGHVGVVESYDPETGLMTFSDSNRDPINARELVKIDENITVGELENLLGSNYTIAGYYKFK